MNFGKIVPVSLREIWPSEATHFTPWLAENLAVLSEKLGMDLELESVEGDPGDFSADIVAHDLSSNRLVVIEKLVREYRSSASRSDYYVLIGSWCGRSRLDCRSSSSRT